MSKKKKQNYHEEEQQKTGLSLRYIQPITKNQELTFKAFHNKKHLFLHGSAGTGKSFISLFLALNELSLDASKRRIIIIRSVVPSRDMGFLPGSPTEKARIYEEPYKQMATELFGRGDAYEILRQKQIVEFTTTSFLRGLTFSNSIVILDEIQNLSFPEINTVMTRIGDNCRIIVCGDTEQLDLNGKYDNPGIEKFIRIAKKIPEFEFIEFEIEDIVRSGIVKSYLIAKEEVENEK